MSIDGDTADLFRYAYAALAFLVCTGLTLKLVQRWDVLSLGERVFRLGLVLEHLVLIYGAYVALHRGYPPSSVGAAMTAALVVVVIGLALWLTGFGDCHKRSNEGENHAG